MLNTPTATRLARLPRLYQTENTPISDKLIHLHFSSAAATGSLLSTMVTISSLALPSSAVIGRTPNGDTFLLMN